MSTKLVVVSVLSLMLVGCLLVVLSPNEVQTGSSIQDPTTALAAEGSTDGECKHNAQGITGYRWRYGTGYRVTSKPALSPDQKTLYVGSGSEHLYALHTAITRTHTQGRWDLYYPEGVVAGPTVSAELQAVFFGAGNHFYAVNLDGDQLWKFLAEGMVADEPAVSES